VDIDPAYRKTATKESPIATSYEIICADERIPPNSEYLLFEDHPAVTIP
jgi:hypothetical protein